MATTVKKANDSSHKYNTSTGKLNPNYRGGSSSAGSSSGSNAVRQQQIALNKMGANLKVDGVSGAKTRAAIVRFGTPINQSSANQNQSFPSSTPIRQTQGTSYSGQTLSSRSSSNTSRPRSAVGGFLSSLGDKFRNIGKDNKNSNSANVLQAIALPNAQLNPVGTMDTPTFLEQLRGGIIQKIAPVSPFSGEPYGAKSMEFPVGAGMTPEQTITANKTLGIESPEASNLTGTDSGSYALSAPEGSSPLDAPTTTTTNERTLADGSITTTETTAPAYSSALGMGTNSNMNTNANSNLTSTLSTLDSSLTNTRNNPWDKYSKNGEVLSVSDNAIQRAVSGYQTADEFTQAYNTDPSIKASVDKVIGQTGKTLADFTAKIQPATNGLVSEQEVGQYLTNIKNTPQALKAQAELQNKQIVQESQFLNSTDKMAWDILAQTKLDSQAIKDQIERNEMRKDAQVRERAQWMMDKNNAEMNIADAQIEQNRIASKKNLTEFLAKIGALRTDGGAITGLETLEQSYQAQRQMSTQKYQLANREIQMNMNGEINDIENAMDDKIFKINMDLNKSEREVAMDSMKLRYSFQKDALNIQSKWQDKLQSERDKAISRAESNKSSYNAQWLSLVGMGIDPAMIPGMLGGSGKIQMTPENARKIQEAKAKPIENALSQSDFTKTYSRMQNDKKTSQSDLEKFKTDPDFQLYMYGKLNK